MTLKSGLRFGCTVRERIKKFYRCANAILRIDGHSDDMIMLQLLETHCLSLLTYAIEIVHVANTDERRQLRVAYNSVFRKIFGYRWSQSVTALQHFLSRPTWEELVDKRKKSFTRNIRQCHTVSLSRALLHWYNDVSEGIYIGTIQLECLSLNYLFFNLTHLCTLVNCCSCHCTALHVWITNQSNQSYIIVNIVPAPARRSYL